MNSQAILPTEDSEQAALFEWAERAAGKYPELAKMYAIPNGGKRHIKTAITLKRTGVKPGVPDVFLPAARADKHGLYIEMKRRKGGATSPEQKIWMNALRQEGYHCEVCKGWEEARDAILNYLEGRETNE